MSQAGLSSRDPSQPDLSRLASAFHSAAPASLFGLRLWASVCLALYVAFWLELDNAYWAGTSAAIVCQPQLGASLRKGWFRMIGTLIGATMAVVLTACFPQDRVVQPRHVLRQHSLLLPLLRRHRLRDPRVPRVQHLQQGICLELVPFHGGIEHRKTFVAAGVIGHVPFPWKQSVYRRTAPSLPD